MKIRKEKEQQSKRKRKISKFNYPWYDHPKHITHPRYYLGPFLIDMEYIWKQDGIIKSIRCNCGNFKPVGQDCPLCKPKKENQTNSKTQA